MKNNLAGYKYMKASPKTRSYKVSTEIKSATLPSVVDLRKHHTPVENQGQSNSCTANAVVGACEYLLKKNTGKQIDLSRLFVYYNARLRKNEQNKDAGSVIQFAMESLKTLGVCSEKTWQFDIKKTIVKPDQRSYKEGASFKITDFQKVELKLDTWKRCLAEGYPIIFGCYLFKTFDECSKKGGIVAMPSPDDATRGSHGAHAMLCVGYSEKDQLFIVRNSWGENWGDKGYCYMPYNYLVNPKFNFNDCWIVKSTDNIPNYQDTWQTKPVSVVNQGRGYDWYNPEEFNYYNEDDYVDFDPNMFLEEYMDDDGEYYDEEPEEYMEEVANMESFEPDNAFYDDYDEDGNYIGEEYDDENVEEDEEGDYEEDDTNYDDENVEVDEEGDYEEDEAEYDENTEEDDAESDDENVEGEEEGDYEEDEAEYDENTEEGDAESDDENVEVDEEGDYEEDEAEYDENTEEDDAESDDQGDYDDGEGESYDENEQQ